MAGNSEVRHYGLLLGLIRAAENEQFKMLSKDLVVNATGSNKTLLHHAALYDNEAIARYLIDTGLDVDALDSDGKTPLTTAVEARGVAVARALLEANADVDRADNGEMSALQTVFASEYFNAEIVRSFLRRLRGDCSSVAELAKRLIDAGCSMYHASFLADVQLMEALIERGIHIDSRGHRGKTALHAAVETSQAKLVEWMIDVKGAHVDAVDECGKSALFDAASDGKADMVRLLLERGANVNARDTLNDYTPLFAVFAFSLSADEGHQKNYDECAELLLQRGAVPENSSVDCNTLLDYGLLNHAANDKVDYLIGQLAIVDDDKSIAKSVLLCNIDEHRPVLWQLAKIRDVCGQLLRIRVHGRSTLRHLLTDSDDKMRIHARNRTLVSRIDDVRSALDRIYPYYSRMLSKRISKAVDTVKLEDAAISAIAGTLFSADYNLSYNFARQVVAYLSHRDLEQLCQI